MLHGLRALLAAIETAALSEAEIYRRERLYARPPPRRAPRQVRQGVLECPICGTRAARFLRFGLEGRRNAQCPACGSVERHRLLWLYLVRRTRLLHRRHRVLHVAPEACLEPLLGGRPHWRYRTVDRFSPFADLQADLTGLPFADGGFDLVLSSHVLEHIPDDRAALAELARVLRPGGTAILTVPFDPGRARTEEGGTIRSPAERRARFGHPYHYRIYGADLVERLAAAGFAVETVGSRRLFTRHLRRRFRLNGNYLFRCTRL